MKAVLIITGDGGEAYETWFAVHRFQEAGYTTRVAAPSQRRLHLVMHDFEPGWDTYKEGPGYAIDSDLTFDNVNVADYEAVIRTLQGALVKDVDASRKAAAKGWRVFKAASPDAKGNVLYIHTMLPAVPGFDYRPSLLVDTLVKDLLPELLTKYQDAFAGPPSKLELTELANMTVAPVAPAEPVKPEVKKPGR